MSRPQPPEKYWTNRPFSTWKEALAFVDNELLNKERRWIFRGLSDHSDGDGLISSLDRAFDAAAKAGIKIGPEKRWKYETSMLYQFKRRAHHYLGTGQTPRPEDFLEWFSLMRHYEAPSRLLDFSYSFYVAVYFALGAARQDAAVFCVDHAWLVKQATKRLVSEGEFFQDPRVFWKYAMRHPPPLSRGDTARRKPFVIPVRPFRSNERIHVQQGLFLCPADVDATFRENLMSMFRDTREAAKYILKIPIKSEWYPQVMRDLRAMNISSESLYPGLSGFAASLKDLLYLEQVLEDGRLNDAIKTCPLF